MSTKVVQENDAEKISVAQKINEFLNKYRVVLISVFAVILCAIIALLVVTVVTENRNRKAFESVEAVLAEWDEARNAADKTGLAAKEDELLANIDTIVKANGNTYAGARASMTAAEIYFSRKDWKNAQDQYLAAAKAAPKAYTAGLNYFNAAVCADELGNQDDAVAYYTKASEQENFAIKPRALFNVGRIEEQRSKKAEAIAAYEKMAELFPDDDWTLLAKSRIIALQIQ